MPINNPAATDTLESEHAALTTGHAALGVGQVALAAEHAALASQVTGVSGQVTVVDGLHDVPDADVSDNTLVRDVLGNKEDAGDVSADTASVMALARKGAKEAWEVEHHFHVRERWVGATGAEDSLSAYVIPPHVDTDDEFGDWVAILDADDTPLVAGSTHYDPHRVLLYDVPKTKEVLLIQFAWGASGAAGYGDGDYTTVMDFPEKPADGKAVPIDISFPRLPTGTLLWCRCKQENANATDDGDLEIFLGIHEYTDPDT